MEIVGKPGEKTRFGCREIHTRDADLGESERARPFPHLRERQRTWTLSTVEHHAPIVGTATQTLSWQGEEDTRAFAERLAGHAAIADAFIALHGELGAGKTTLVRHLLRALGAQGRIKSPTYALVEPYELPALAAWHFDFYRFDDPKEWEDAGLRDLFASTGLKIAEWPDKAAGLLPVPDLEVRIAVDADDHRQVRLQAHTARGRELLA